MEKKAHQHQQIRGWEEQDEKQAYTALYSRITHPKRQKNHLSKIESLSTKFPDKRHMKFSSNSILRQKRCIKLFTQTKYRQPWQLHNDKKTLLQFLKKQSSKQKLKSHQSQMKLNECIGLKPQQKIFSATASNFIKPKKQLEFCPSLQFHADPPSFKQLFIKLSPVKKQNRKRFYLKAMSFGSSNRLNQKKQRSFAIDLLQKTQLKKNSQLKNKPVLTKKKRYFPLFYRQLQQNIQKSQKRTQVLKNQLKLHKKNYKSQFSMPCQESQQQEEFIDTNILTNNNKL